MGFKDLIKEMISKEKMVRYEGTKTEGIGEVHDNQEIIISNQEEIGNRLNLILQYLEDLKKDVDELKKSCTK